MSATIGTCEARTICFSAAVESVSGQETRMMSTPTSSQRLIWSIVALASEVGVLVMVWTVTGASPPTGTLPTMICRDLRRTMSRQGLIDMIISLGATYNGLRHDRRAFRCSDNDVVQPIKPAGTPRGF